MLKLIKLILGFVFLISLGLVYGAFNRVVDEQKEPIYYTYISFGIPNSQTVMTIVKRTPESKCEKWRLEYYQANKEQCVGCEVLHNKCSKSIPNKYLMAFDKKDIGSPYVYKPYKYPEITVIDNPIEGMYEHMCSIHKESLASSECYK